MRGAPEWLREGRRFESQGNLEESIRCYAKGIAERSELGLICRRTLALTTRRYRIQRQGLKRNLAFKPSVVVAGSELSHNAAGRAFLLWQCYREMGYSCEIVGCHFPRWGRELWQPLRSMGLPVESFVVDKEPLFVEQAMDLVLHHPADLVHVSKPRLPAVVMGLLYKWLWAATVVMDIDDEELCFVGEREPINFETLHELCDGRPEAKNLMGPLWTRLAVHLGRRFDGITVANGSLQQRYGGTVVPHARDPEQLKPATTEQKAAARQTFGVADHARVVLFFGTPRRHKGVLAVAAAIAALPEALQACFVVAGEIPPAERKAGLERDLLAALPPERLRLLGNQPFEQAAEVLALADLVVILGEGEVATFQSPAKLSDALAMGLPVIVSDTEPLREFVDRGWVVLAETERLVDQLQEWLNNRQGLALLGQKAREGFLEALTLSCVAARVEACAQEAMTTPLPMSSDQFKLLKDLGLDGLD